MTTLDHVIATHQSEWVSFNEEPLFPVPPEGGTEGHLAGLSSSSGQSESSSGENQVVDGGSQDLSHSEQDDSSEKMGLISEAASPPGSPEQPPADLASAISNWVQFEDDAPWASVSPPHKETGLPLTMPCWTCPSFNSLGRCPLTSESSWTTHSEDTSSPSCGPSYTDLQLIGAEEQMSGRASGADSTDERTEWQTGRQTAVSPVQACTEHTSTRTHVLDPSPPSPHSRRSQSPREGLEGTSAPKETSHLVLLHIGVCSGVERREQSRVQQRRLGKNGVMEAYAPLLPLPPVLLLFPVYRTTPLPVDGWIQN